MFIILLKFKRLRFHGKRVWSTSAGPSGPVARLGSASRDRCEKRGRRPRGEAVPVTLRLALSQMDGTVPCEASDSTQIPHPHPRQPANPG